MGLMKRRMEEQVARGFYDIGDKYVCPECFYDYAIKECIVKHAKENTCSYCKRDSATVIAAPMDVVLSCIVEGLRSVYGDPNNEGVPWDGGWVGKVYDTYDVVLDDIGLAEGNEKLLADLLDALGDRQWCQVNFWSLLPEDVLKYGWEEFSRIVKNETRYLFLKMRKKRRRPYECNEIVPPNQMLLQLGKITKQLDLIQFIPKGTELFRCRIHTKRKNIHNAYELGPPPEKDAKFSNRMSPAGIPMFYGAFDIDTCLLETCDPKLKRGKQQATIVKFQLKRKLVMLDLTSIPGVSIFDESKRDIRPAIVFLHGFSADISKPIAKDGKEHIEYVPSQIVTEYYRRVFKPVGYPNLDGLIYHSSKNPGATAYVIFCINKDCVDVADREKTKKALLTLSKDDIFTVDLNTWKTKKRESII